MDHGLVLRKAAQKRKHVIYDKADDEEPASQALRVLGSGIGLSFLDAARTRAAAAAHGMLSRRRGASGRWWHATPCFVYVCACVCVVCVVP